VASREPDRPNILFVLTDDQDVDSVAEMPTLVSRLVEKGTTFDRAFATTALCCPSRTSILRGQYAHNHHVWGNLAPAGGFRGFQEEDLEGSTVATWLDEAGYHTGYMGKYLNEYGTFNDPIPHVPPGWDRWIGFEGGPGDAERNGALKVNDQGEIFRIGGIQDTDYLAQEAEDYIRNREPGKPWFLMVATNAPHEPAAASERNDGTYADSEMPKTPGFNEANMSDKAEFWRRNPRLENECEKGYRSERELQCLGEADEVWRNRMESLQDVDDMMGRLFSTLSDKGFAENTYVVFTSDNGFATYRNRIFSKAAPYEYSHGVPLIVRGPGVAEGAVDHRLVANIDLAPTFAELAEARRPSFVDGRSLVPILADPDAPWRTRLLFEQNVRENVYEAIRTASDQVYIEYPRTEETEYYDLKKDPYQLDGQAESPPRGLKTQLGELATCAGARCREADGSAPP
jgi:N-acetylglucosamine-6-sulfatase